MSETRGPNFPERGLINKSAKQVVEIDQSGGAMRCSKRAVRKGRYGPKVAVGR